MADDSGMTRRDWLASLLMGIGLIASYGMLAVQAFLFVLPKRLKAKTRFLFAGSIDQFQAGSVETLYDLEGNQILINRGPSGIARLRGPAQRLWW